MRFQQEHFWNLDKTEFRIPPKLTIQIWDNDKFSLDDYLGERRTLLTNRFTLFNSWETHSSITVVVVVWIPGTLELSLHNLIPPAKTPEKCTLSMMDDVETDVPHKPEAAKCLFTQKSARGWWPCSIERDGHKTLGVRMDKIDLKKKKR